MPQPRPTDIAIAAAADALLAICAVQTGTDPHTASARAHLAIGQVLSQAAREHGQPTDGLCHTFKQGGVENCWKKAGHTDKHSWEETEVRKRDEPSTG